MWLENILGIDPGSVKGLTHVFNCSFVLVFQADNQMLSQALLLFREHCSGSGKVLNHKVKKDCFMTFQRKNHKKPKVRGK